MYAADNLRPDSHHVCASEDKFGRCPEKMYQAANATVQLTVWLIAPIAVNPRRSRAGVRSSRTTTRSAVGSTATGKEPQSNLRPRRAKKLAFKARSSLSPRFRPAR